MKGYTANIYKVYTRYILKKGTYIVPPQQITRVLFVFDVRGSIATEATKGVELPKPHGHSGDGLRCLRCLRCLPAVMALGAFGRKKRRPQAKYFTNKNSCGKNQSKMTIRAIRGSEWLAGEQDDREFDSKETYLKSLADQDALPIGFQLGSSSLKFVPEEAQEMGELPMKLTVICLDEATDKVAAVFTQNAFPGAPVKLGRRRMAEGQKIQAIVVNNKISNVSPPDADGGVSASETICSELANNLKLSSKNAVLPSSTGVIGWRLPVKEMIAALRRITAKDLSDKNALEAAEGIMTTDRYPKLCSRKLSSGRLVGIAKGAGMIEPNMATMLCFLMTDVDIPREELQEMLSEIAVDSFNAISVDGDESTSDTVILLSSGKAGKISKDEFKSALRELCCDLSAQIVRNGEGTQHVIRVTVTGAESDATARRVGKAVVNGPLFKSAIAGLFAQDRRIHDNIVDISDDLRYDLSRRLTRPFWSC